jgi:hypothetical protein
MSLDNLAGEVSGHAGDLPVGPTNEFNSMGLRDIALEIVARDLTGHGNVLSQWHRASLLELLDTFTSYCAGREQGRKTFGLPTGMGKTSAVVAFVAALNEMGYRVPIAIASSRVQALTDFKLKLLEHGVPSEHIGFKHSSWDADEESTGDEARLIQLVTHARVRQGLDLDLFSQHQGIARPLMIWDESMLRADGLAFGDASLRQGIEALKIDLEGRTDELAVGLKGYLQSTVEAIAHALDKLQAGEDPDRVGLPLALPKLNEDTLSAYRRVIQGSLRSMDTKRKELLKFLDAAQSTMQAVMTEQGSGVVSIVEAIPASLKNVVILDASADVRALVHSDRSIRQVKSFKPAYLKDFAQVQVHQLLSGGGRSTLEGYFRAKGAGQSAVCSEVLDIVKGNLSTARAFLFFTVKSRGDLDMREELGRALAKAGINPKEQTGGEKPRPRFEFLTWGNHEGINGYEHCDVVIMVGVVQRSLLELTATMKAQAGLLAAPTPPDRLRAVRESEVAHAVYQGASRGSCRRVHSGMAGAMKLYIIHKSRGLETLMAEVMPNAVWSYPEFKHLTKATEAVKTQGMLDRILVCLANVPEGVTKISTTEVKKAMGMSPDSEAEKRLFSRTCKGLELSMHGWQHEGRSFVRGGNSPLVHR